MSFYRQIYVEIPEQPSCSKNLQIELKEERKTMISVVTEVFDESKMKQLICDLVSDKSMEVQVFIKAQLFHKPNFMWTQEERSLFLKIQYKSPSAFESLRKMGFALPGESTIRDWYNQIPFSTAYWFVNTYD